MKSKLRFGLYLVILYALVAVLSFIHLQDEVWLLVLLEAALLLLLWAGFGLLRQVFQPLELLGETTMLLNEGEFTTRLKQMGLKELDQLIGVYNRMAEQLRKERVYNQEQEHFLKKILDVSPAGILLFDYDERITSANPSMCQLFNTSEAQLQGKSLRDIQGPLANALDNLSVGEARIISFQGRRRLKISRGHFLDRGFYKSFMLVDELTEELMQTEKAAYDKLIRIMSHEINNSIGAANSLLHSCLHYKNQIEDADREDFETAIGVIISRTEHLKAFMSDYADVARLPAPNKVPTDPNQLLSNIRTLMDKILKDRNIRWEQRGENQPPLIQMDGRQMEQVFLNMVKNAVEAIDQDGTITVEWRQQDGRPLLILEDTGPGIPPEIAENLFTPFFTSKKEGQGIGLTLIREILTQHRFDFSLESPQDEPTRFRIWF